MKGNINPFSGDKQYQTDRFLSFKLSKIEEIYINDLYNRNHYNLILLCIFSMLLMIISYFSSSCYNSSIECTHQFLFIIDFISIFCTIYLISKHKQINHIFPIIFLINGIYPYVKILEEFEGRITWILITIHLTILAYFLLYSWKKVLIFEVLAYCLLFLYIRFWDFFLIEPFLENWNFGILSIIISVFLFFLHEKASKETWVLFDSFKKSERLLEFLIDELNFPIFLVDNRNTIVLNNSQARILLQQAGVKQVQKSNPRGKITGINRNFFEIFPQKKSQNIAIAKTLLNSVFYDGKNVVSGLLKLTLNKGNIEKSNFFLEDSLLNHEESSQIVPEEWLYEMCCQNFVWKGMKCGLVGLKADKYLQMTHTLNDVFIQRSLQTLMNLIYSHSLEEASYYDSLLQNSALMENNKLLYYQLYFCHSLLFFTLLLKNFMLNNFEKLTLEPESHFFQLFLASELMNTIRQILRKKTDKYEVTFEILKENHDKNPIIFEKKYSKPLEIGQIDYFDRSQLNPEKKLSKEDSDEQEKNTYLYGPCYLLQHLLIIVIKSVMKLKICKKIKMVSKIEKLSENSPELASYKAFDQNSVDKTLNNSSNIDKILDNDEESMVLRVDISFEEPSDSNKHAISNNMLVGDLLLSTFKEKKRVLEYLVEIMKNDQSFLEADREASFLYLRDKKPQSLGIFLLPYMIKALDAKFDVTHDEEFNKTVTKFTIRSPIQKSKKEEAPIPVMRTAVFNEKKLSMIASHEENNIKLSRKKPVLTINSTFHIAFVYNNRKSEEIHGNFEENKHENMFPQCKHVDSKEFILFPDKSIQKIMKKPLESHRSSSQPISNIRPQCPDLSQLSSAKKTKLPPLLMNSSQNPLKKTEIYVEEELKKYLFHLQNGFTLTVENILQELLNEESSKEAKIIFPPKSYLFQEKGTKPETNSRFSHMKPPKKVPSIKNVLKTKSKSKISFEEKDDNSSFLFTESNKTESAITNKSVEEELLNNTSDLMNNASLPQTKENPKTQSNKIHPRKILNKNDEPFFRSPNLFRTADEGKHVLVRGESLIKYLKNNAIVQENNGSNHKEKYLYIKELRGGKKQPSDISKLGKKTDARKLTYTRKWVIYDKKPVMEINCAIFDRAGTPSLLEFLPKNDGEKKVFIRKPNKKPKSIVSEKDGVREKKKFPERLEENKKEEGISAMKKPKNHMKYQNIMANLSYKEKVTILAYDSENQTKDLKKCKGIKSLAWKVGHDNKFELCNSGTEIIKNYKGFIRKSCIYHFIIIELEMPEIGGWKCVKKIRNFEAKYRSKQRSFICGLLNENENDYEVYVRWGFDEFLRKPFNSSLFEEILKRRVETIKVEEEKERNSQKEICSFNFFQNFDNNWFRNSISEVVKEANLANYQKEPILMLTIDDNYFILMGMSNLRLKVFLFSSQLNIFY